jgi:hypothetical protein
MRPAARIFAVVLLIFVAAGALYAGSSFIKNPSGQGLGMNITYLAYSPFSNYFIPGIILFTVFGIFSLVAAGAAITQRRHYAWLIFSQGTLLSGWILVQVIMVRDFAVQQWLFLIIGILLSVTGWLLSKWNKTTA